MIAQALLLLALIGFLTSSVYLGLAIAAVLRFRRVRRFPALATLPPATLLKPLHGMEPRLRHNLESFFRQDYPRYEIVFGCRSADDPALAVVGDLCTRYPQVPVRVVISGDPPWANAKVYNLHRMLSAASHDLLVISDSDVCVDPDYLAAVTRPLLDPKVGMTTCVYRGAPTGGLWSRLEALGMSVEFTSGVLVADMLEGMKFALGPTMAIRRDCLQAVGGFPALADYLADDYVLGNLAHAAGYDVVLSQHVIEHCVINRSLATSVAHQVRWAKSTRRSRPKGHAGSCLTFAMPFALLGGVAALALDQPKLGLGLLALGVLNRWLQCWVVGWGAVRDPRARSLFWLYPLRDLLGFFFWAASFLTGSSTTWRGQRYRIQPGGRMVPETSLLPQPARTAGS